MQHMFDLGYNAKFTANVSWFLQNYKKIVLLLKLPLLKFVFNLIPTCCVGLEYQTDYFLFPLLPNKDTPKEDKNYKDKFECRATHLDETMTQIIEIIYEDNSLVEDPCVMKCVWMYQVLLE